LSIIKNKSLENFTAIDILNSSNLYSPGIHCAYYSSLQLLIHYFYEYCNFTEEEVDEEIRIKGGSHNFYLSKFVDEIRKLNAVNASKFYSYFSSFKRKRNEADYKNIEITPDNLMEAKKKAEKIRKFLNNICVNGKCENIHYI